MIGTVAGVLSANPILGGVIGCAIGAALGGVGAGCIISQHFDVNYDRMKTALTLVIGSAAAGTLGGVAGGFLGSQWATDAVWYAKHAGNPLTIYCEVDYTYSWHHLALEEAIIGGALGGITGLSYYFTN